MKNILLILLSLTLLHSCETKRGSGNIEKRDRKLSSFNKLSVGSAIEVEITKGTDYKAVIQADDNIIDDIETDISGGELQIGYRDGVNVNDATVKVLIETPLLNAVDASSASSVKLNGVWSSDKEFRVEASSSGNITGEVDAPAVRMEASSSGKIVMKGRTKNLDAETSSAGIIEAGDLLSENARVEANSGSSMQIHASLQLRGEANSGASIAYRGNPSVNKEENSGGSISKID